MVLYQNPRLLKIGACVDGTWLYMAIYVSLAHLLEYELDMINFLLFSYVLHGDHSYV